MSVAFAGASVPLPAAVADAVRGSGPDVVLGLRPEALHLSDDGAIGASVIIVELLGAETHVICHTETGARMIVRQSATAAKPKLGEAVRIAVDPDPRVVPPLRRRHRRPAGRFAVTADAAAPAAVAAPGAPRAPAALGPASAAAPAGASRRCWPTCCSCRRWCSSGSSPSIPSCATSS